MTKNQDKIENIFYFDFIIFYVIDNSYLDWLIHSIEKL